MGFALNVNIVLNEVARTEQLAMMMPGMSQAAG